MDADSATSESIHSGGKDHENVDESSASGSASMSGSSTHASGSTGTASRFRTPQEEELARKESRHVFVSKVIMLFILFLCTMGAGLATYFLIREEEYKDFTTDFLSFTEEMHDVIEGNHAIIYGMIDSFEDTITSLALTEWEGEAPVFPNITVPHFEKRADDVKSVTGAILLAYAPLVEAKDRAGWEAYSVEKQGWLRESYVLRGDGHLAAKPIRDHIFAHSGGEDVPAPLQESHCPLWQLSYAPVEESVVNFDLLSNDIFKRVFEYAKMAKEPTFSEVFDTSTLFGKEALSKARGVATAVHPESLLLQPVVDSFDKSTSKVVGAVVAIITWDVLFVNALHGGHGVLAVLEDTCGGSFSYLVNGPDAEYLGAGDKHDTAYNDKEVVYHFNEKDGDETQANSHCHYSAHFYPTRELENEYRTSKPAIFTVAVVGIFVFTAVFFLLYDFLVRRRQEKVQSAAMKSNAIVSSLFPKEIRERLFQQNDKSPIKVKGKSPAESGTSNKFRLKNYLDGTQAHELDGKNDVEAQGLDLYESKPIADLFPNTTVMFADIVGFTAWSSVREPSQVFTLLETLYRAFDRLACKRRVFKVETVGDCYVAVAGLPEPREDHAIAMSRFAKDCLKRMFELTHKLEVILGPDTGDLGMRFGLHSGPVTAGVLRGDKSRFQLFGDTVNTAARMESTGARNKIQISSETASLLRESGKEHWFVEREDTVIAKGKGELQTFWLFEKEASPSSEKDFDVIGLQHATVGRGGVATETKDFGASIERIPPATDLSPRIERLISWNVDVLLNILKLVVARRIDGRVQSEEEISSVEKDLGCRGMPLDEVVEVVNLPEFNAALDRRQINPRSVVLPSAVEEQLAEYVKTIATMYRDNPFHNFDHASHVTMSVTKLLSRIVAPDLGDAHQNSAQILHDHTYGITSDPLTQFSVILSALIHDVDHVGIPNFLLIEESPALATLYAKKAVAEQNSFDLAWGCLMEPRFRDLRHCIYKDTEELQRFRQLMANTVLATDIFDKEIQAVRKKRWDKAFSKDCATSVGGEEDAKTSVNRKATIVMEHLIQASDVAHTMQHWHVYCKWNERFFAENVLAYKNGRSSKDPATGWYNGELWFFDNYIIPLAKKLHDCGVFGVSSDEYLNYALANRNEWELKGEAIVAKLVATYCRDEGESTTSNETASLEGGGSDDKHHELVAATAPEDESESHLDVQED